MSIDYTALKDKPRLLLEATLKPLQGERFQATGFADLGAALYTLPDGTKKLLVESAQSVANRLELVCWSDENDSLIDCLQGLPYVKIDCGSLGETNTLKEFHRLNSPYLWKGDDNDAASKFRKDFCSRIGVAVPKAKKKGKDGDGETVAGKGILDRKKLSDTVFWYDPCSLIHGVFLEKLDGRLRLTRALSGFIEATKVERAESGGVKIDHVLPSPKTVGLKADEGFGNVPFHRAEFTAESITAYFNLDLALIRGYRLDISAEKLLIALSLLKVQCFLENGLRLRAACDLEVIKTKITKPSDSFELPSLQDCKNECIRLINECKEKGLFSQSITHTEFRLKPKDVVLNVTSINTEPTLTEERKKQKTISIKKNAKVCTVTIKASLVAEIGFDELADQLGPELYPNDLKAQADFAEIFQEAMASDSDETEEETNNDQ